MRSNVNAGFDAFLFACDEAMTKESQVEYVPFFHGCQSVLDLACGRGYFLDLLSEAGIECLGVDHDPELIADCRARGHKAEEADALSYLRVGDQQFDGIMLSHLIEHFSGDDGLELLKLAVDRLAPGGRLVVVTPNPENDDVLRRTFWLDWDHKRPVPRLLLVAQLQRFGLQIGPNGSSQIVKRWFRQELKQGLRHHPGETLRALRRRFTRNGLQPNFLLGDTYVVAIKPTV